MFAVEARGKNEVQKENNVKSSGSFNDDISLETRSWSTAFFYKNYVWTKNIIKAWMISLIKSLLYFRRIRVTGVRKF